MPARSLGSRACSVSTCAWLLDYAGPDGDSRYCPRQCFLPVGSTRSAPGISFSKLDSSPVNASVYTSPGTSRHPAQDSRSRWFATPFLWGSFIPDCTPVYPDACASFPVAAQQSRPETALQGIFPKQYRALRVRRYKRPSTGADVAYTSSSISLTASTSQSRPARI